MLESGWAAVAERDGSTVVHIGPNNPTAWFTCLGRHHGSKRHEDVLLRRVLG
jgi:hypothetical protein